MTVYNNGNEITKGVTVYVNIYEWTDQDVFRYSDLRKLEEIGKIRYLIDFMVYSEKFALLPDQSRELVLNCNINKEGNYYGGVTVVSYSQDEIWHDELIILAVSK